MLTLVLLRRCLPRRKSDHGDEKDAGDLLTMISLSIVPMPSSWQLLQMYDPDNMRQGRSFEAVRLTQSYLSASLIIIPTIVTARTPLPQSRTNQPRRRASDERFGCTAQWYPPSVSTLPRNTQYE